jgi:predicted MPP superfamily phosphohydrolase
MTRRRFLRYVTATGITGLLGGALTVAQSYRFEVNRYQRTLPKLTSPLRVAHLSDLHFGVYSREESIRAWVDATLTEQPDIVFLTGDLIDYGAWGSLEPLIRQLARLEVPLGVYGVWGNHDYDQGIARRDELHEGLESIGVRMLVNERVQIRDDLEIAGVDDLWKGEHKLWAALEGCDLDKTCIFLCHIPDIMPGIVEYGYSADLTLSGHNHGGQIKLPLVGALKIPSKYGPRFLEGWITEPTLGFVSRGLGFSALPIRIGSTSEVVIIDLQPEQG